MGHFQVKIPLSVVSKSARLKITTLVNREENDRFVDYEITESLLVLQVMLFNGNMLSGKHRSQGGEVMHVTSSQVDQLEDGGRKAGSSQ